MIIDRDISNYVVSTNCTVGEAIHHVVNQKGHITLVVTENGLLQGLLTHGDILRWITHQPSFDLQQSVVDLLSNDFRVATPETSTAQIEELLRNFRYIPIVDSQGRLTGVARERKSDEGIRIETHIINHESSVFVVAEIGINHNGNFDLACRLVDEAARAGADCAKFQMRDLKSLYSNAGDASNPKENLGSQYTLDLEPVRKPTLRKLS